MHRAITVFLSSPLVLTGVVGCLPGSHSGPTSAEDNVQSNRWQDIVDAMKALTDNLAFPKYLAAGESRRGDEFDVNDYFTVLRHLTMEPGFVLDYVYSASGTGGRPILYARREDDSPYQASDYPYADGYRTYLENRIHATWLMLRLTVHPRASLNWRFSAC